MLNVYLNEDRTRHSDEIVAYLNELFLHDCNFGNREFEIFPNQDFTYLDGIDEILGTKILNRINSIGMEA